jgi:hypothetical protein
MDSVTLPVDIPAGLLTPKDAARELGVSEEYLAELRLAGMGPAYIAIVGEVVRYHPDVIDSWKSGIKLEFNEEDW